MDPSVPKMQFNETTIPLIREHFRMVAEVRALKGWVREMWLQNSGLMDEPEGRKQFDSEFAMLVEQTFSAMLEEMERTNPRLAALLDNRDIGEIPDQGQ
ncbi:MAG TPA: hypothetical protein VMZ27_16395 [Candidatus Saccharimonadales bacterium]|nr:hypothetical protein [Candidatus Saccharimonadales bacterium]